MRWFLDFTLNLLSLVVEVDRLDRRPVSFIQLPLRLLHSFQSHHKTPLIFLLFLTSRYQSSLTHPTVPFRSSFLYCIIDALSLQLDEDGRSHKRAHLKLYRSETGHRSSPHSGSSILLQVFISHPVSFLLSHGSMCPFHQGKSLGCALQGIYNLSSSLVSSSSLDAAIPKISHIQRTFYHLLWWL